MLPFLFNTYKDEIFCSIVSRYHRHSGNKSINETAKEISGQINQTNKIDLPILIGDFIKQLPNVIDTKYIIMNHTLYPFYFPFMLPYEKVLYLWKFSIKQKTNYKTVRRRKHYNLKYCPACVENNFNKYGEAYFHRIHQFPGLTICQKHLCRLYEYEDDKKNKNYSYIEERKVKNKIIEFTDEDDLFSLQIIRFVEAAFRECNPLINKSDINNFIENYFKWEQSQEADIKSLYYQIPEFVKRDGGFGHFKQLNCINYLFEGDLNKFLYWIQKGIDYERGM